MIAPRCMGCGKFVSIKRDKPWTETIYSWDKMEIDDVVFWHRECKAKLEQEAVRLSVPPM